MSRRASTSAVLALAALVAVGAGCEQLDGRSRTRSGNRMFGDKEFVDAAAQYEKALTEVDDPIIHYNLGLTYSKVFHPGSTAENVLLDVQGSFVCSTIPGVTTVQKQVCIKEGDKHFDDCDDKHVCASSFQCLQTTLCQLPNAALADLSAKHFESWLTANPTDSETRALMTQVWLDSSQYQKALDYWSGLLQQKPNDAEIMGSLAGINLKAGDWRKSIEWYNKVADATTDVSAKVAAYQFIGNVAWSKLNSRTLTGPDTVELADRGIGALQKAAQLQPDNPKPVGLQASIFNFRGSAHGASFAGAVDRATAADLQHASRVLREKAKKAQELAPGGTPAPAPSGAASTSDSAKSGG